MVGSGVQALVPAGTLGAPVWMWQDLRLDLWNRGGRDLEGLQDFGALPDFSPVERSGRHATVAALRGKVWIANFIYTYCTDTCPWQSARTAKLQEDTSREPRRRPPDPADGHEEAAGPKPDRLLSGVFEPVPASAHSDFPVPPFLHSALFVLVDRQAGIRGCYPSDDEGAPGRLRRDAKILLRDGRSRSGSSGARKGAAPHSFTASITYHMGCCSPPG